MPRILLVLAVAATTLALAPAAWAADRFAAPSAMGTGDCSSEANACTLATALSGSTASDAVLVLGNHGDFNLTAEQDVNQPIPVTGINGRPRLIFSSAQGLYLLATGASAGNLYVQSTGAGAETFSISNGGSASNVIAKSTAYAFGTCFTRDATISNSVCWASGGGDGVVVQANLADTTDTFRNVTALAPGGNSIAVDGQSFSGNHATLNLTNVIARGGSSGASADIRAYASGASSQTTIDTANSNYAVATNGGAGGTEQVNGVAQTATPLFVDAADGDFHQAIGSPTIDAGTNAGIAAGETDFDGNPRIVHGTADIGADEFMPAPTVETGSASGLSRTAATLGGTVNPNAAATTYHFDYGKTTTYGSSSPGTGAGSATSDQPASAALSNLPPGTTFHYRLVATNASGTSFGADRTFTTASVVPPICKLKLKAKRGKLTARVTCDQDTTVHLSGKVKDRVAAVKRGRRTVRTRRVTLKKLTLTAHGGRAMTRAIKLPKRLVRDLRKKARETATLTLTGTNANGTATASAHTKLLPGRKKH